MGNKKNNNKEEKNIYEFNTNLNSLYGFNLSLTNDVSIDTVNTWLNNPMIYNKELRNLSRKIYTKHGIYARAANYMVALPTLDKVISGDYDDKNFEDNKNEFKNVLDIIDDKSVIRDYLLSIYLDGTYFAYFNVQKNNVKSSNKLLSDNDVNVTELNAENNATITVLPIDYCKIIGIKNNSYQMAFNMQYFDQFADNDLLRKLLTYPQEIINGYKKYSKNRSNSWLILDNKKTIVQKINSTKREPWGRPVGLAAFIDLLYDAYFVKTKRNVLDDVNNTIIYQTFPEGSVKGKSSLTKDQQKNQHNNIKKSLFARNSVKGISFFSVASGTKLDKIKNDVDILKDDIGNELIKRISTQLGFASSILNGEDGNFSSQQTNLDVITAQMQQWIDMFTMELNKVINANILHNREPKIKVHYLPTTYINRKEKFAQAKELYTLGRGSLSAWIASAGWDVETYINLMKYEAREKWDEKFPVHPISFTSSNKDKNKEVDKDEGGRPENDNPTNPETIKTKTNKK